jgi:hypothetical protein
VNPKTETRKKLKITIDGERYTTHDDDQEGAALVRLAGKDPERYDIAKVKANGELHVYRNGKVIDLADGDEFITVVFAVEINDTFVELDKRKQTGASLKEAAIAAGVPIQADFVLSEVLANGEQQVIADDHEITVKYHDDFWAVPGDDNS